jgi:recombination protein RecT
MAYQQNRKPSNQIVPAGAPEGGQKLSTIYLGNGAVDLVKRAIGDEKTARRMLTTLLTAVQNNTKLQECDPKSVINAALDGEVAKNLSLSNGEYYIIPYKQTASMQLSVRGLEKLCLRSRAYADVGAFDVREGEFKGLDSRTRRPIMEWITDLERREELPIIGYYAFYELSEKYNNMFRSVYWTHNMILNHANRHSNAFNLDTYNRLLSGEIQGWDAEKLRRGSPWYGEPLDMGHRAMCEKTVMKQLLKSGWAPKEINEIVDQDDALERTGEPIIRPEDIISTFPPATPEAREAVLSEAEAPEVKEPAPAPKKPTAAKEAPESPKEAEVPFSMFD